MFVYETISQVLFGNTLPNKRGIRRHTAFRRFKMRNQLMRFSIFGEPEASQLCHLETLSLVVFFYVQIVLIFSDISADYADC
jgi:hypothetical protein